MNYNCEAVLQANMATTSCTTVAFPMMHREHQLVLVLRATQNFSGAFKSFLSQKKIQKTFAETAM